MSSALHQFLLMQAAQLREGRLEAVARCYSNPLIVALRGIEPGFFSLATKERIAEFLRVEFEGLQRDGLSDPQVSVLDTGMLAGQRRVATISWNYSGPEGDRTGTTTARYFVEQTEDAFVVQMIEFEKVASPAMLDWFRRVGLAMGNSRTGLEH